MLAIRKDIRGNYFSFVYGMWGALIIGNGTLGGMMNNPYEHGQSAANIG
jgi:hypothetical protein